MESATRERFQYVLAGFGLFLHYVQMRGDPLATFSVSGSGLSL